MYFLTSSFHSLCIIVDCQSALLSDLLVLYLNTYFKEDEVALLLATEHGCNTYHYTKR